MKQPPRFRIAGAAPSPASAVRIAGAEFHHMCGVMRLRTGEPVTLFDDHGGEFSGVVASFGRGHAMVEISPATRAVREHPELILAVAIIKGPRMDFLVEKAAELGATRLWPLVSRRSYIQRPGPTRTARWRRLAIAAAKQSFARPAMEIAEPRDFASLMESCSSSILAVICNQNGPPLGALVRAAPPRAMLIACGPEGGFEPDEIETAQRRGFAIASVALNRLRSETAALAALAIATGAMLERNGV